MAEDVSMGEDIEITLTQLRGKNDTYIINPQKCWISYKHSDKSGGLTVFEAKAQRSGENILIYQFDYTLPRPSVIYYGDPEETYENDDLSISKNCQLTQKPLIPEHIDFTTYIERLRELAHNCEIKFLPCILDYVWAYPMIYLIIPEFNVGEYYSINEFVKRTTNTEILSVVYTTILQHLSYLHKNGFVYRFLSGDSIMVWKNDINVIRFNFDRAIYYRDPAVVHRLFDKPEYASDINQLGTSFLPDVISLEFLSDIIKSHNAIKNLYTSVNMGELIARSVCVFPSIRPTADEAIALLKEEKIPDYSEKLSDLVRQCIITVKLLEDEKYPTAYPIFEGESWQDTTGDYILEDMLELPYTNIIKQAVSEKNIYVLQALKKYPLLPINILRKLDDLLVVDSGYILRGFRDFESDEEMLLETRLIRDPKVYPEY